MKQIQQEEIFAWFQNLSGAKRIELMCGLISMCIPLETRFFETIIQDVVKKDLNSFSDAEMKANTFQELDLVCKCDLLLERINQSDYYDDNGITTPEMNGNVNTISNNNIQINNNNNSVGGSSTNKNNNNNNTTTNVNSTIQSNNNNDTTTINSTINNNNNNNLSNNKIADNNNPSSTNNISTITNTISSSSNNNNPTSTSTTPNISQIISNYPSRSKLIISLCLMRSTNSSCSSLVFQTIRKQLTPENVCNAVYNVYLPKNLNIEQLFSELLLLLTMAMYHPAFTYEQRDVLGKLKKDIEELYYDIINNYIRSQHLIAAAQVVPQVPLAASMPLTATGPPPPISASVTSAITSGPPSSLTSGQTTTIYQNPSGPPPQTTTQTPQQQQTSQQAPNAAQSHHTQPPHQYHHSYHQSTTGNVKSHHPTSHMGPPQPLPPQTLVTATQPQQSYSLPPFIGNPMPMASIAYTTPQQQPVPGPMANINNQTNAVIQNMALLKINSPQQSSSPSPSQSPSSITSNKIPVVPPSTSTPNTSSMPQFAIKLPDSLYNPMITIVDNNAICLPTQPLLMEDSKSSTASSVSSSSCYNCGNMGHRGTECTSVVSSSADE